MTERAHISREDLSLYGMQALSPEEAAVVRAHVENCEQCRNEAAEVAGDLALLALSVEQHPVPEGARQKFADRIAADAAKKYSESNVTSIDTAKPVRRVYSSIQWSAVAAMLVLAFALMLKNGDLNRELKAKSDQLQQETTANARAQQVLNLLTAKEAQHVVLTAANAHPAPSGRAVYLAATGGLLFQGNNLAAIPAEKTYELWVIPANGQAPIPAGLFRPDAAGNASVVLPTLPSGVPAKAFGVTLERAEGSQTPTAPILLVGAAPSAGE
ncbi:MAG TPA: anti-sigma factor [Terracidiphilus sp.]|jgi:anti-sigma-K factor RskA|nr:anti-sigma factor [Terracidiphilus sp.]